MVVGALIVFGIGMVGYVAWNLAIRQDQTAKKLWETEAALQSSRGTLQHLEDEHRALAGDYETLKGRWAKTSEGLQQLASSSAQMSATLSQLSQARADLQHTLEASQRSTMQLHAQLAQLRRETSDQERAFRAREAQWREAASRSLTLAELEQVSRHLLEQQTRAQMLNERVVELSTAYEQLAQQSARAPDGTTSPRAREAKPSAQTQRPSDQYLAAVSHDQAAGLPRKHRTLVWDWLVK